MSASDNAKFDPHATDPAKLSGPEAFDKEVEKRMTRLTKRGTVLGAIEYLAKQYALSIESVSQYQITVEAPYAGQLTEFARRCQAMKGVARVTQSNTGRSKKSSDGKEYPIGKVIVILDDDLD